MSRKAYPSHLTGAEWRILEPWLPARLTRGRPREIDMREIINAIFYGLRSGCAGRMMPHDFPAWQTAYGYFWRWRRAGLGERLNDALRKAVRLQAGREAEPSAAIMDRQRVKTTETKGKRGYDSNKKVTGRQRHILVDGLGLSWVVLVHKASIQERAGAQVLLQRAKDTGFPRLRLIWADGGYGGQPMIDWVLALAGWVFAVITRPGDVQGFSVLPRRWVVERTFAGLGRYRRLSKDYEELTETSEAMIYAAMVRLMVRRLARHPATAP